MAFKASILARIMLTNPLIITGQNQYEPVNILQSLFIHMKADHLVLGCVSMVSVVVLVYLLDEIDL